MIKHYLKINPSAALLPVLLFPLIFLPSTSAFADSLRKGKVFIGADLGAAQIYLQRGDSRYDEGWLYGSLWAEYGLSERLLLGVEGAGWTDQEKVKDPVAEDVMAFMLTAKVYPWLMSSFYIKTGWGYVKHRYWETSPSGDAAGTGYLVGLGIPLGTGVLQASYSRGELDLGNYRALTLSVSFPLYVF